MMTYTEKELVALARRENNKKRNYLVVNRLQGKHIPVSPEAAFQMFESLADILQEEYGKERLLLIGFAETATAIGASVAGKLDSFYIQTTRERIEDVEYFYFSEQHSHATEQKVVKTDIDQVIGQVDRVIFIEDEITTGNTILNIVRILKAAYPDRLRFSAASLLNGMDQNCREIYEKQGIRLHYLVKTDHQAYEEAVSGYRGDGAYHDCNPEHVFSGFMEYRPPHYRNARRLIRGKDYMDACRTMCKEVFAWMKPESGKHILVVGTEEFMYPALYLGYRLEKKGNKVKCHSTTRSPIEVSSEEAYPLHVRYELRSLYDDQRKTFLYDIAEYDEVWIVTDAREGEDTGITSLIHAVRFCGNDKIRLIRWC